jgi:hypothetical protein
VRPQLLTRRRPFGLGLDLRRPDPARRSSRHTPFSAWEALTSPGRHPAVAAVSFVLHAALLLLLLFSPRLAEKKDQRRPAPQDTRSVQMVYLPPKPAPAKPKAQPPAPPQKPPAPAFPDAVDRPTTEPPSPAAVKVPVPPHDEVAAMSPRPAEKPGAPDRSSKPDAARPAAPKTPEEAREDAMVSEARRIFGAPTGDANVTGPVQKGLPLPFNNNGPHCAWGGGDATPIDRPKVGVIEGIVRTESGGKPIPGAFLQMLGSGAATFSDDNGHYRLTFDPSLVDACRSQLVRVTAKGYRERTMILMWGPESDNVVDMKGGHRF